MKVTFWGTRGSIGAAGPDTAKYGGNTSCVEVRGDDGSVIVLDAGTGIRRLGRTLDGVRRIDVLLTHLHMDHLQGLGFFAPLYDPAVEMHIWGPASPTTDLRMRLRRYLSPPLFPVHLRDLPCKLELHEVPCGSVHIGELTVTCALVCHPGPTVGYRIESSTGSLAYISDHEPALGVQKFPDLCDWTSGYAIAAGVDVLIHDGQYSREEYPHHVGWGHSATDDAVRFAALAGVGQLVLFHHDPSRTDAALDRLLEHTLQVTQPSFPVNAPSKARISRSVAQRDRQAPRPASHARCSALRRRGMPWSMTLRVALVGGPMYDRLYRMLDGHDVDIVVHADHPTLNRAVADRLASGERLDVISTHAKYAPSQARWLRPLDSLLDPSVLAPLAPKAIELCRFDGALLAAPRNIDVRILWANRRRLVGRNVPSTWSELAESRLALGFPGRESGLFGTFFEIVSVNGGSLFDSTLQPTLQTAVARHAVQMLLQLAEHAPADLPDWHYDQVDAALGDGRVALAAAWPGATAALRAATEGKNLEPYPYLSGPVGLRSYAGCHAWAIPKTCADLEGAVRLVEHLCSAEANALEAASGAVCAHVDVFSAIRGVDEIDARRLEITRRTIAEGMITYPPLVRFPEIEDAGWGALHKALRREIDVEATLIEMQKAAELVLSGTDRT